MSASVDTTTKLSYLLPTGTFLTFQVIAPLATNNGHCGLTEQILTAITLALLVAGCIATSFTDSFTAEDGKVYNGFLTSNGLWVPGYGARTTPEPTTPEPAPPGDSSKDDKTQKRAAAAAKDYIQLPMYELMKTDYMNAALSAIAFLTLTMFTDPVSSCFYPNLSESVLKTLPVLLATMLSFCCSFVTKVRHGYGNSVARPVPAQVKDCPNSTDHAYLVGTHDVTASKHRGDNAV